jgi:hypothetical protein
MNILATTRNSAAAVVVDILTHIRQEENTKESAQSTFAGNVEPEY